MQTHRAMTEAVGANFPNHLKSWRAKRRMSQLDLALTSGVSQRHVSFLESGRAKPSRAMILQLTETLDVPLRDRNQWLVSAGFAPLFQARALDDPEMSQVMGAVRYMLDKHEPFPAAAIDRMWNVVVANKAFDRLFSLMGGDLWTRTGDGGGRNLLRVFFHPEGLKRDIANWRAIAPLLWHRARREAEAVGGANLLPLLDELAPHQDAETLWASEETALVPLLPVEVIKDGVRLAMFTVIATFGTAQDVTADELRIESFFPADSESEALLKQMAGA